MADEREVVITIKAKNLTDAEARAAAQAVLGLGNQVEGANRKAQSGTQSFKQFVTEGMNKAGLAATDNGRLIAGMSQSGMAALATQTQNATTHGHGFRSMLGQLNGALATFGIGLGVGTLIGFGRQILADADALVKLHDKTDLSIGALQAMRRVGLDTGVSIESMASAVSILERKIAGGDDSVVHALADLGLSYVDIRNMSPEEMWFTIAEALKNTDDKLEQVRLSYILFGKTADEVAPAIKKGFGEIDHSAEMTVRTLDEIGDAFGNLWEAAKQILAGGSGVYTTLKKWAEAAIVLGGGTVKTSEELAALDVVMTRIKKREDAAAESKLAAVFEEQAIAEFELKRRSEELEAQQKKNAAAAKEWAVIMAELNSVGLDYKDTLNQIDGETVNAVQYYLQAGVAQGTLAKAYALTNVQVKAVATSLKDLGEKFLRMPLLGDKRMIDDFGGRLVMINAGFGETARTLHGVELATYQWEQKQAEVNRLLNEGSREVTSLSTTLKGSLKGAVGDLNGIFQSAFEGGGGVSGAISSFATKAVAGLTSAIPVIGPIISQFSGAIVAGFKKLFGGPSKQELEGRDTVAKMEQQLHSLLTKQQKLEAGGEKWKMTVIAVRDAYVATGRSQAEAEAAVQHFWQAQKQGAAATAEAFAPIQAILDQQKAGHEALNAAVQKYGFTVDELGPKFRNQKLHEMAAELFTDYGLLTGASMGVGVVTGRMAEKVNEYIATVRKAGTEVPAEMRPMLETFAAQGKLTDENGNKITDLKHAGIRFATTMSEGFKGIIDKLDELLVGIGVKLPAALNNIPDADFNIRGRYVPPDGLPEEVEAYTQRHFEGHARGGVFSNEHIARIAEGGRSEIIGDIDFMTSALVGALNRVGSGTGAVATGPSVMAPSVYILVDRQGEAQLLTRQQFRQLERAMGEGVIRVTSRAVGERVR